MPALPVSRGPGGTCRAVWRAVGITCAGRAATSIEQAAGRLGDDEILSRRDAQDGRAGSTGRQDGIPLGIAERRGQPQHPQPADDPRADRRRVLADPAGEHERRRGAGARWRPPQSLEQCAARTAQRRAPRRCRLPRRDRAVRACRPSPPRRAGRTRARAHPQGRRSRPRRGGAAAGFQGRPSPIESPSSAPRAVSCPSTVEADRPPSTAVTEQPLPRWATTSPSRSVGRVEQLGGARDRPLDG